MEVCPRGGYSENRNYDKAGGRTKWQEKEIIMKCWELAEMLMMHR